MIVALSSNTRSRDRSPDPSPAENGSCLMIGVPVLSLLGVPPTFWMPPTIPCLRGAESGFLWATLRKSIESYHWFTYLGLDS